MRVGTINIAFWLLWIVLFLYFYLNFYDDPTSFFYDKTRAYEQRYSLLRTAEAEEYLSRLEALPPSSPSGNATAGQRVCIGIPSVNRTTRSFLSRTLASLTDTLSPDERDSIHFVVLLANKSPKEHTAYGQAWLERLADEVLVYGDPADYVLAGDMYHAIDYDVFDKPRGDSRVESMRLDHSVLVETCRNRGSTYFALVEDDVIASRDWFRRLNDGIDDVNKATSRREHGWAYLRMFYSETFMGWNSEEWLIYSESVVLVYAIALGVFLVVRQRFLRPVKPSGHGGAATATPNTPNSHGSRTDYGSRICGAIQPYTFLTALALGLWLPALILLYFMAGRVSVSRVNPFHRAGVREMPRYGCCAQGLVFPQERLEGLQKLLREPPYDFAGDMKIEGWVDSQGLSKWALDPSVLQHVGLKESSEGPRLAEVWNFSFERHSRRAKV